MDDHRKQRLRRLIDTRFGGDRAAFCGAAELTNGRISQLLDPNERFGEVAAKNLAAKLGLPERYFEQGADGQQAPAEPLQPDENALLQAYRALEPAVRAALLRCANADTATLDMSWLAQERSKMAAGPAGKRAAAKSSKARGRNH